MIEGTVGFNGATLNDQTKESLTVSPFYFVRVINVDGLWGGWQPRHETYQFPGADGVRDMGSLKDGQTYTVSGQIEALKWENIQAARLLMEQMTWDMDLHDFTFYIWDGSVPGTQVKVSARTQQPFASPEELAETDILGVIRQPFVFSVFAPMPLWRKVSDSSVYPAWRTVA